MGLKKKRGQTMTEGQALRGCVRSEGVYKAAGNKRSESSNRFLIVPLLFRGRTNLILLVTETRTLRCQISTSGVLVMRHWPNYAQIGFFNRAYSELSNDVKTHEN